MSNKKILGVGALIAALTLVIYFRFYASRVFMNLFHKTGIIGHYNANGKFDGEVYFYQKGNVIEMANFKDGLRNGWEYVYYSDGNIKTKSFYRKDQLDGIEFNYYEDGKKVKSQESFKDGKREGPKIAYYENGKIAQSLHRKNDHDVGEEFAYYESGKLKYKRNWVDDKPFGDLLFHYENGKIKSYAAYDILGIKFYLSLYDESEKLVRSDGYVFSSHIYSKDLVSDSVVLLKNNRSYKGIKDLYIVFANSPNMQTAIKTVINNKTYKDVQFINDNTMKILDAFPKTGIYNIVLTGGLIDKSNVWNDFTTLELSIKRLP